MPIITRITDKAAITSWDSYVLKHPDATVFHLFGWKSIIEETYHHKTYYLCALKSSNQPTTQNYPLEPVGILPLVHLKHFIFGNNLISVPFFDTGGILADDDATQEALLTEAINWASRLRAATIELRHSRPLLSQNLKLKIQNYAYHTRTHKVRMLLPLPDNADELMGAFKSKLRSQIRKPIKEGLTAIVGRTELLDDFYRVFAVNMRDLGSPVHSKNLIRHTLEKFPENSRIVVVYKSRQPLAASVIVGFRNTLANPWASSLREFSRLSPNMLLYWTMLEYACESGFKYFDFGRSTPGEGTYRFKKQWGAKPDPLHWLTISIGNRGVAVEPTQKDKFGKFIHYWQKMPVAATTIFGPMIRRYIGL